MSFWCLQSTPDQIALLRDSGEALTYLQLAQMAQTLAARLPAAPPRTLGFLLFDTSFAAVALYLGTLLSRRHVPLLLQPTIHPALLQQLIDRYQPEWIAAGPGGPCPVGYDDAQSAVDDCRIWLRAAPASLPVPHAELALLLSTSGSTGSPKLVRLSYEAIAANAEAIARYLHLTAADRAVTTLPLAYSFGLSILNSHLAAGAS